MEDLINIPRPKKILYMGYNYNSSYFMIGTDIGFQVHQSYPLALKFSRILKGGIGLVQILNKSNIFCLAGGGLSPKYAPNKLMIWDDKKGKEIYEFRFNSNVTNCFIKLKYIFVFCEDTINIISMQTMKTVEVILTISNKEGVGTISSAMDKYILCWPDLAKGKIAIKDFSELKSCSVTISASNQEKNSIFKNRLSFKAHTSKIYFLKLNDDGSKLATASERGNIIRIFDTIKGCIIQELKRGNGDAKIYSINFSFDNNFLGITSDHGTAHIFVINKNFSEVSNLLARSSKAIEEENKKVKNNIQNKEKEKDKDKINNNNNEEKNNNLNDFDILDKEEEKKNNLNDFDIIDKENIDEEINKEEKKVITLENNDDDDNNDNKENKKDNENNIKNKDNGFSFEILNEDFTKNEEMTKSEVLEAQNCKNQKSFLSGVGKIIGFSSIFQSEWSFASFKIPYKQKSLISFIQGDKNNNKLIVIDKEGNYNIAEINENKEAKIIQSDILI